MFKNTSIYQLVNKNISYKLNYLLKEIKNKIVFGIPKFVKLEKDMALKYSKIAKTMIFKVLNINTQKKNNKLKMTKVQNVDIGYQEHSDYLVFVCSMVLKS